MLTPKQLTAKISGIAKRNATLRDDIQTVLIHAAGHALKSRDVTFFTNLLTSVVGQDRTAITKWVHAFGLAKLDSNTGSFKLNKSAHKDCAFSETEAEEYVEELTRSAANWYDMCDDAKSIARALDVAKRIEALASSLDKAIEEGKAITFSEGAIKVATMKLQRSLENANRLVHMRQNHDVSGGQAGGMADDPRVHALVG